MTQFAVASEFEVRTMRRLHVREYDLITQERATRTRLLSKGWLYQPVEGGRLQETAAGWLALELREALGPDRSLAKAGAKALVKGAPTRATKIRLMDDGLWKREYMLGRGHELAWLTEAGLRVREILMKNRGTS